jgi:hypothetical protein
MSQSEVTTSAQAAPAVRRVTVREGINTLKSRPLRQGQTFAVSEARSRAHRPSMMGLLSSGCLSNRA